MIGSGVAARRLRQSAARMRLPSVRCRRPQRRTTHTELARGGERHERRRRARATGCLSRKPCLKKSSCPKPLRLRLSYRRSRRGSCSLRPVFAWWPRFDGHRLWLHSSVSGGLVSDLKLRYGWRLLVSGLLVSAAAFAIMMFLVHVVLSLRDHFR